MRSKIGAVSLFLLVITYLTMVGGGTYEQLNVTRIVASAPPQSLYMLKGEYAFTPILFWILFRPLTFAFFLVALASNWTVSIPVRKFLLLALLVDVLITLATYLYFAPETGALIEAPYVADKVDPVLLDKAQQWKNLNVFQLSAFYLNSLFLLSALRKSGSR